MNRIARSIVSLISFVAVIDMAAAAAIIPAGSNWRYWDRGSEPLNWREPAYDDSAWEEGPAELGYGDGDEATIVSFGPNSANKYVTTYFRKSFNIEDLQAFSSIALKLWRDDGAVVYLNGLEIARFNMPAGQPAYSTFASTAIEETLDKISLASALFNPGQNVLAVEIHQANPTSSDISFDLELAGEGPVIRGPYLQLGTADSIVVRWRTVFATESIVRYGTSADPGTWAAAGSSALTTEHEVKLTSLSADTAYYYSVGNSTGALAAGPDYIFYTSPLLQTASPVRIWVLGDSGTADANAAAVRDAYYEFAPTRYTDLLLMLGDNAYNSGMDNEYQAAVFDMYPEILRQTVLWPTIGNHDTAGSTTVDSSLPYFQMFTLPTQAEAGGMISGTEKYYSFDYANVHFICLDSMTSSRQPGSAMLNWLESDLAVNTLPWVIAFWHHPPYSKGSHNSDNTGADYQMVEMRQNVLPILEAYNVDLVLAGHSHSYERSFLLKGHYGFSSTLDSSMKLDSGSGRDDGSGSYNKTTGFPTAPEGAVYIVAGSSGKISGGALNHPAMFLSLNELGSLVLDVNGDKLDVKFLRENGAIRDYFSIVKGNQRPSAAITAPADGSVFFEQSVAISADASDIDGNIVEVAFYANDSLLGRDFSGPFGFLWTDAPHGFYDLTVLARDDKGVTVWSAPVGIVISTESQDSPPAAPGNLVATGVSKSQIDLTWSDNSFSETEFIIERNSGKNSWVGIGSAPADATAYSDTGLAANKSYSYRVQAYNDFGASDYSNKATGKTLRK